MGFGSKSRKQAQQAQVNALNEQTRIQRQYMNMINQYNSEYDTRNADIIDLNRRVGDRIEQFERGEDITKIYPLISNTLTQGADAVRKTMDFTQGLGTNAYDQQDDRYQQKLRSVGERQIASNLASAIVSGVLGERDRDTGLLMDTSNYLSADKRAGYGLVGQGFQMSSNIFNNATTRRQMEMQRSNMMMGNLMSFISGGLSGFGGLSSAMGWFRPSQTSGN